MFAAEWRSSSTTSYWQCLHGAWFRVTMSIITCASRGKRTPSQQRSRSSHWESAHRVCDKQMHVHHKKSPRRAGYILTKANAGPIILFKSAMCSNQLNNYHDMNTLLLAQHPSLAHYATQYSILYRQNISSVNNFVQLQRKGFLSVENLVHGL